MFLASVQARAHNDFVLFSGLFKYGGSIIAFRVQRDILKNAFNDTLICKTTSIADLV